MNEFLKHQRLVKLISNNQKLLTLSKSTNYGFFIVDHNNILVAVNKKSLEILGFKYDELIGKNASIFSCENCNKHCGFNQSFVDENKTKKFCTLKHKNGETITIIKSFNDLIDENGAKLGKYVMFEQADEHFITYQDVLKIEKTEKKHTAKELIFMNLFF